MKRPVCWTGQEHQRSLRQARIDRWHEAFGEGLSHTPCPRPRTHERENVGGDGADVVSLRIDAEKNEADATEREERGPGLGERAHGGDGHDHHRETEDPLDAEEVVRREEHCDADEREPGMVGGDFALLLFHRQRFGHLHDSSSSHGNSFGFNEPGYIKLYKYLNCQ